MDSDGFVLIVAVCVRSGSAGVTAADHSDPCFAALQANGVDAQYERVDFGGHGCVRLQNIAPRRCLIWWYGLDLTRLTRMLLATGVVCAGVASLAVGAR